MWFVNVCMEFGGVDIHAENDAAFRGACRSGQLEVA
jgi:hypothetical protein